MEEEEDPSLEDVKGVKRKKKEKLKKLKAKKKQQADSDEEKEEPADALPLPEIAPHSLPEISGGKTFRPLESPRIIRTSASGGALNPSARR